MYMNTEKLYQDKDWLERKYIGEKLNAYQIAEEVNRNNWTIYDWLRRFNISIRSYGDAHHLARGNHCDLSQKAIEWINGELLGDGCLRNQSPWAARIQYGSKYEKYINYISDTLNSFDIKQAGNINKRYHEKYNCYTYLYNSHYYEEFLPIKEKWYLNGKKIVPRDIELTPLTCRQWYIGDGSLTYQKSGRPRIILCTCSFPIENVEYLILQLDKIGFKATRWNNNNVICICSVKDFLNYIGECPVKCYQYKWDYNKKKVK